MSTSDVLPRDCVPIAGPLFSGRNENLPIAIETVFDPVTVICRSSSLVLDDWQEEVARGKEDLFCCTSRQVGKTTSACVGVLAHILSTLDGLAVVVSPTQRQSNLILKTVRKMFFRIPPAGRPRVTKDTSTMLVLANGSTLMALPSGAVAGGSNLRGLSPSMLIIEEGAFLTDSLYFDVLKPMRAVTRARTLIITSPNATTGWCYDLYCSGTMRIIEVKAEDCSRISKKWLEKEQKSMPKAAFLREYCCRWIALGAGVFDVDAIEKAFVKIPDNPFRALPAGPAPPAPLIPAPQPKPGHWYDQKRAHFI